MKKICALLVVTLLLTCSSAFASQLTAGQIITACNTDNSYCLGPTTGGAFAKLSTGVSLGYATSLGTYAIETKHVNGDKCFGAAANDGKNYWKNCDVNSSAENISASDSTAFPTNTWSSL